jgi:hypothetical protein
MGIFKYKTPTLSFGGIKPARMLICTEGKIDTGMGIYEWAEHQQKATPF